MINWANINIWRVKSTWVTGHESHYPPGNPHASHLLKCVLFPGHNHPANPGTDDQTIWVSPKSKSVKGHQYRWLAGGYDLEIGHFLRWLAWWLSGG